MKDLRTPVGSAVGILAGLSTYLGSVYGNVPTAIGTGGLAVGLAGVVTALMPALLRVVDGILAERKQALLAADHRASVEAKVDAQAAILRDFLGVVRPGVEELVEVLKADRAWMQEVAAKFDVPLPEDFGRRSFDAPGAGVLYRRLLDALDTVVRPSEPGP